MDMSQKYTETLKNNFRDTLEDESIKSGNYTAMMQLSKDVDIQEDLTGVYDEMKEQMDVFEAENEKFVNRGSRRGNG